MAADGFLSTLSSFSPYPPANTPPLAAASAENICRFHTFPGGKTAYSPAEGGRFPQKSFLQHGILKRKILLQRPFIQLFRDARELQDALNLRRKHEISIHHCVKQRLDSEKSLASISSSFSHSRQQRQNIPRSCSTNAGPYASRPFTSVSVSERVTKESSFPVPSAPAVPGNYRFLR